MGRAANLTMMQWAEKLIFLCCSGLGGQFHHGAVGRALGRLNIWKFSPPKACGRIWVSFVPSQAICAKPNYPMDNVWEIFGASDMLKSVEKDSMGVLDKKVALRD